MHCCAESFILHTCVECAETPQSAGLSSRKNLRSDGHFDRISINSFLATEKNISQEFKSLIVGSFRMTRPPEIFLKIKKSCKLGSACILNKENEHRERSPLPRSVSYLTMVSTVNKNSRKYPLTL